MNLISYIIIICLYCYGIKSQENIKSGYIIIDTLICSCMFDEIINCKLFVLKDINFDDYYLLNGNLDKNINISINYRKITKGDTINIYFEDYFKIKRNYKCEKEFYIYGDSICNDFDKLIFLNYTQFNIFLKTDFKVYINNKIINGYLPDSCFVNRK